MCWVVKGVGCGGWYSQMRIPIISVWISKYGPRKCDRKKVEKEASRKKKFYPKCDLSHQ